jgi:hypothetical protein
MHGKDLSMQSIIRSLRVFWMFGLVYLLPPVVVTIAARVTTHNAAVAGHFGFYSLLAIWATHALLRKRYPDLLI